MPLSLASLNIFLLDTGPFAKAFFRNSTASSIWLFSSLFAGGANISSAVIAVSLPQRNRPCSIEKVRDGILGPRLDLMWTNTFSVGSSGFSPTRKQERQAAEKSMV